MSNGVKARLALHEKSYRFLFYTENKNVSRKKITMFPRRFHEKQTNKQTRRHVKKMARFFENANMNFQQIQIVIDLINYDDGNGG